MPQCEEPNHAVECSKALKHSIVVTKCRRPVVFEGLEVALELRQDPDGELPMEKYHAGTFFQATRIRHFPGS
ncbi:hypothetical protein D3C81_531360 [compost metagenome]